MNLLIDSIEIKDFLSIGKASVSLGDQGLVLVSGINNESPVTQSNGSGKSSIFDAIFWAFTGETIRGSSNVVNEKSDTGCLCRLCFHDEHSNYVIERSKVGSTSGLKFYVDEELVSDQVKKGQEMINQRFEVISDPSVLGSIVLLGQGLPYRFSSLSPSKRKDLLESTSKSSSQVDELKTKLDIENETHVSLRDRYKQEKSKTEGLISGLENTLEVIKEYISSKKSPEEVSSEINKISSLIGSLYSEEDSLSQSIEGLTSKLDKISPIISSCTEYLPRLNAKRLEIISKLSGIKSGLCPTCGRPFEVSEESLSLKTQLESDLGEVQAQIEVLTNKIDSANKESSEINSEITRYRSRILEIKSQISAYESKIQELKEKENESINLIDQKESVLSKITEYKIVLNDLSDKIKTEEEYIEVIQYFERLISREFKGYVLEEVINYISSRSEYYSGYLFSGSKRIKVSLSGNRIDICLDDRSYENLSGGERQRADLAVQFALRDMLVVTTGFSCNILVLDEVFDNLDEQGSTSLMNLITNEFSDLSSIFIITHHADIDVPHDKEILVTKDSGGISTVNYTM